jgi:hypothetical protein
MEFSHKDPNESFGVFGGAFELLKTITEFFQTEWDEEKGLFVSPVRSKIEKNRG